ncbi:aminotransferase [Catellatospora methionotrophica]|uniref:Aminotransferase n=1 Tax=Catellatospora methionotrophica TaxID=121620 RepID=A0A8J3LED1_9ACTN|nr:Rv2231c family pyridoxal phosphate-dependent protein CobC [Catellatospora methionotrophica]GIG17707.1 aminotransferase [Catellatospora methionotrophica]
MTATTAASGKPVGDGYDLGHHGDTEVGDGLIDLAVNVRQAPLPDWLAAAIRDSLTRLDAYPDGTAARAAVAARHRREPGEVLLTAGAAQAFTLLAQGLRDVRHPVVIHPQFTEPEAALLAAGHRVTRVLLPEPFTLDPAAVPDDADLVLLGNPTNPTSVAHPADTVARLARPGRILVVDEAFADTIPGEPHSLATRRDLPGLVVVRSLTKTWALAGLRVGYLLAAPDLVRRLAAVQPLWPVSTPALAAAAACATPAAVAAEEAIADELTARREHLLTALRQLPEVAVAGTPASSFVLLKVTGGLGVRARLRDAGYAVRRADTFPGLGPDWLRIAVRDEPTSDAFVAALAHAIY